VLKVIRQMYDVAPDEYIPEGVVRFWSVFIEDEEENHMAITVEDVRRAEYIFLPGEVGGRSSEPLPEGWLEVVIHYPRMAVRRHMRGPATPEALRLAQERRAEMGPERAREAAASWDMLKNMFSK
jgi:hypothetical protein